MACKGEGAIVLLGNTRGTLCRNIIDPMREIWGEKLVGLLRGDSTIRLFGERVHVLGADNRKHVARIQGMTIEYAYGDEMTTWAKDVFEMLKSRLRCPHSAFDGTCNPDHPQHFMKAFIDSDADLFCQTSTIDDNPFLPEEFVKNLKKEYAGTVYYDRFILGRWAIPQGLVYPRFSTDRHVLKELPECCSEDAPPRGEYYLSIDYGTQNPFSAGLWCVWQGRAYRIAEYYYDGRKEQTPRTDEEHYQALEDLASRTVARKGRIVKERYPVSAVVIDPSAASMIACIRRHGRFSIRKAANDVLPGIGVTASLLAAGKIKICENCKDCLREFELYRWDEKAGEDRVLKENDHAMDDIRYFCYTILRKKFRSDDWRKTDVS